MAPFPKRLPSQWSPLGIETLSTPFYINYILLQWRKSVPKLQGLIIIMKLNCKSDKGQGKECLQAKVLGTWQSSGE